MIVVELIGFIVIQLFIVIGFCFLLTAVIIGIKDRELIGYYALIFLILLIALEIYVLDSVFFNGIIFKTIKNWLLSEV